MPTRRSHAAARSLSLALAVALRILPGTAKSAARFLPVIWPTLLVLLVTGSLLIIGEPRRALLNATFYLKMALLLVGVVLTAALQRSFASTRWEGGRVGGRLAAVVSILVWCGILFAGRWIAYTQP